MPPDEVEPEDDDVEPELLLVLPLELAPLLLVVPLLLLVPPSPGVIVPEESSPHATSALAREPPTNEAKPIVQASRFMRTSSVSAQCLHAGGIRQRITAPRICLRGT